MQRRRSGSTDLEVSEICFGPMRFASREPGNDELSKTGQRALARALERGVNFIHSCQGYGTRWALGKVLKDHPKRKELQRRGCPISTTAANSTRPNSGAWWKAP